MSMDKGLGFIARGYKVVGILKERASILKTKLNTFNFSLHGLKGDHESLKNAYQKNTEDLAEKKRLLDSAIEAYAERGGEVVKNTLTLAGGKEQTHSIQRVIRTLAMHVVNSVTEQDPNIGFKVSLNGQAFLPADAAYNENLLDKVKTVAIQCDDNEAMKVFGDKLVEYSQSYANAHATSDVSMILSELKQSVEASQSLVGHPVEFKNDKEAAEYLKSIEQKQTVHVALG